MIPYLLTTVYTGGFRGRNTWLTFEEDHAQLAALRQRVTAEVTSAGNSLPVETWPLLLALRQYVHAKLPHDSYKKAPSDDAFTLLNEAEQGASFRCVEHGKLLCQVYQAFGIPARVLSLEFPGPNLGAGAGHVLCEAWWDEGDRWVVMDSEFNAHWEADGKALSALEIQARYVAGRGGELTWVMAPGTDPETVARRERWKPFWSSYFTHVQAGTDEAFLSRPTRESRAGQLGVEFLNPQAPPQLQFQGRAMALRVEADPNTFSFAANRVAIHVRSVQFGQDGTAALDLELEHCAPWFDRFEVQVDGGGTVHQDGSRIRWSLGDGEHLLTVRTVNAMGRKGQEASLGFLWLGRETMGQVLGIDAGI